MAEQFHRNIEPLNRELREKIDDGIDSHFSHFADSVRLASNDAATLLMLSQAGILMKYDMQVGVGLAAVTISMGLGFKYLFSTRLDKNINR